MSNFNRIIPAMLVFFAVLGAAVGVKWYQSRQDNLILSTSQVFRDQLVSGMFDRVKVFHEKNLELEEEKIRTEIMNQQGEQESIRLAQEYAPFWAYFEATVAVAFASSLCLGVLIISGGKARAYIIKSSVFTARIGESEIPVSRRELPRMTPVLTTLANAQLMEAHSKQDAFHLLKEAHSMTVNVLRHGKVSNIITTNSLAALPEQTGTSTTIPTFAQLIQSGQLAKGKEMILAYEDGRPHYGNFKDIYSSAIAGESGSGKSSTQLFLIGSGLIAGGCTFYVIDPHYPHKKSLGKKLEPLIKAGLIKFASYIDDMAVILNSICQTIDKRLAAKEESAAPVILVIDEVAFLAKTSIGKQIFYTMERISTEGRKCAVYMLAASQTWLTARTGGNSVVRDTLTSAYVHRIKPKQANAILQDGEEAKKVRKYVRHPGECLFIPVGSEPILAKIPLTIAHDMEIVKQKIAQGQSIEITQNIAQNDSESILFQKTINPTDQLNVERRNDIESVDGTQLNRDLLEKIKALKESQQWSQNELARRADIDPGLLSRVLRRIDSLTDGVREKLETLLTTNDQQESTPTETRRNVITLHERREI